MYTLNKINILFHLTRCLADPTVLCLCAAGSAGHRLGHGEAGDGAQTRPHPAESEATTQQLLSSSYLLLSRKKKKLAQFRFFLSRHLDAVELFIFFLHQLDQNSSADMKVKTCRG